LRYLKYDNRFISEVIRMAHQPHITCLDELWQEIEHTPSLQAVFFNALVAPSPKQQQLSLSLRSLFERRFRFSLLNSLPEQCGNVEETQRLKHQEVTDRVVMKDDDNDDEDNNNDSMCATKAVIILDEHTMADYWAPDEHTFKNYACLGAFKYRPSLLSPAAATVTNVRQSEHLQLAHIVMPSKLHKNGLPPVLFL